MIIYQLLKIILLSSLVQVIFLYFSVTTKPKQWKSFKCSNPQQFSSLMDDIINLFDSSYQKCVNSDQTSYGECIENMKSARNVSTGFLISILCSCRLSSAKLNFRAPLMLELVCRNYLHTRVLT